MLHLCGQSLHSSYGYFKQGNTQSRKSRILSMSWFRDADTELEWLPHIHQIRIQWNTFGVY